MAPNLGCVAADSRARASNDNVTLSPVLMLAVVLELVSVLAPVSVLVYSAGG
jgi:hypothetical protein